MKSNKNDKVTRKAVPTGNSTPKSKAKGMKIKGC